MSFFVLLLITLPLTIFVLLIATVIRAFSAAQQFKVLRAEIQDLRLRLDALDAQSHAAKPASAAVRQSVAPIAPADADVKLNPASQPRPPVTPASSKPSTPTTPTEALPQPPKAPVPSWLHRISGAQRAERRVATSLAIAIGAISIALGCIFLVKLSFNSKILGPAARVSIGAFAGVALVAGGWLLRRGASAVAQGIAAAGVLVFYISILAAADLYHFIVPWVSFVILLLWTGVAIALSLAIGPLIAVMGLLGGLLTPALLDAPHANAGPLFLYLLLLQAALFALSRRRQWLSLAVLAAIGANVWVWIWVSTHNADSLNGFAVGLFVLASTVLLLLAGGAGTATAPRDQSGGGWFTRPPRRYTILSWIGVAFGVTNMSLLLHAANFSNIQWMFMLTLAAGSMLYGRMRQAMQWFPFFAAAAIFMLLLFWSHKLVWHPFWPHHAHAFVHGGSSMAGEQRFYRWLAVFGVLFSVGGYACLWGASKPKSWAILSVTSASASVLLALLINGFSDRTWWAAATLAIAVAYLLGALAVHLRAGAAKNAPAASLSPLAAGTAGFIALAIALYFQNWHLTLALAAELLLAGVVWRGTGMRVICFVMNVLALVVVIRLIINPGVYFYPISPSLFLNWITFTYGGSVALFFGARQMLRTRRPPTPALANQLDASMVILALAGVTLWIHHAFHLHHWNHGITLAELSAHCDSVVVLSMLVPLLAGMDKQRSEPLEAVAAMLTILAIGIAAIGLLGVENPFYVRHAVVGPWDIGIILPVYLIPAGLFAVAGVWCLKRALPGLGRLNLAGSFVLCFATLSLLTRGFFHPYGLSVGPISNMELYAYSLVWALAGILLLLLAIKTRAVTLRYASLAVMLLTILKVFLVDTSHLQNLLRVLSLVGLGVSLLALGLLYQKFVFRTPDQPDQPVR